MSNPDDLTQALAQNGAYNPAKAEELRKQMVGAFEAKVRKAERYLWVYMCLCCWLFVFAMFHFMQSSGAKALLFYGILMLVFFETTILMKLWYWIMNNKIGVLKAIKQLELGEAAAADAGSEKGKALHGPLVGLSRRERAVWWVVLIAGIALVGAVKGAEFSGAADPWDLATGGALTSKGCITLAADGSGSAVTEMSFVYEGTLARRGFDFYSPKSATIRFTDGRGREMPFTTSPQNGHIRYDVRLPRPVMPGRRFSYTQFSDCPSSATEKGGVWTYSSDVSYGYDTNDCSQTVVLPEGAEIVSANPWPVSSFTLQGKPTVRFEATRGRNDPFKYTVQYRLAEKRPAKSDSSGKPTN
jgi:hypothetical protein